MSDYETVSGEAQEAGVVGYQPETPFVLDGVGKVGASANPTSAAAAFKPGREMESPFASEYVGETDAPGPKAELYAEVLSELETEEFEVAVTNLVNEATELAEDRFSYEGGSAEQERVEAERGLRDYYEPMVREWEALVDRVAESVRGTDLSTMSESEFETLMESLAPTDTGLPGTQQEVIQEFFLGKIKGALDKVRSLATKLSPAHIIMGKLKDLARPLLERVLRMALDKLPVAVRPIARQLAARFLGLGGQQESETEGETEGETAAADPGAIAREFDAQLAGYMVEGEEFERHVAVEQFAAEQEAGASDTLRELQEARADFARDITELPAGESAAPVVERFVPAILAALKLGIKIIGRPKVVNFLAGLVAKLIAKYVGAEQSVTLSRALVDTGMQIVGLEAPEGNRAAGYALASTLEDTIARVTQEAPATAWEDEEVLESYVRDAFGKAASAHFPDTEIRSELHEATKVSGAWIPLPAENRRKHYKKFSRVLDVSLTPQMATALKTFGGGSVQAVLRDQLGLTLQRPIAVRVHLYEAVPGASLPDIAMHEKNVRGLGTSRREAWSQIHPLTPEAAGILCNEPGLGRQVDARFLADPHVLTVGQRLYYIESPQARSRMVVTRDGHRAPRVARTKVTFDFPRGQLRVRLYFSEAQAQAIATQLRGGAPASTAIAALKSGLEDRLATMFSGAPTRAVRIIHESAPFEHFQSPIIGGVLKIVGRPLAGLTIKWILEALKRELDQRRERFAAQFTRAAASEADGVTVVIVFQRPSFFQQLRAAFGGRTPLSPMAIAGVLGRQAIGEYTVTVYPGYPRRSRIIRLAATRAAAVPGAGPAAAPRATRPVSAPTATPAPSTTSARAPTAPAHASAAASGNGGRKPARAGR
jgi:hypothetical protein